jgi:hypothetical protein
MRNIKYLVKKLLSLANKRMDYNNTINEANLGLILDSEELFKIKMLDALNKNNELKNFEMIKSMNKYCSVDFAIINKYNLLSCYVEHKCKKIKATDYNTFFIGYNKLAMIEAYYGQQTLFLVFECLDKVYFCEYDEKFLKRQTSIVNGGKVILIEKSECGCGFEKLTKKIVESLTL